MFTAEPVKHFPLNIVSNMKRDETEAARYLANISKGMLEDQGINPKTANDDIKRFHLHTTMDHFLKRGGRAREAIDINIQNEKYRFRASHIEGRSDGNVIYGLLKTPGGMTHKAAMKLVGSANGQT